MKETAKKTAEELVHKFDLMQIYIEDFSLQDAKECALIAVDEMIKQQKFQAENMIWSCVEYWEQVKQEIITI